jgi:hypothetical protein
MSGLPLFWMILFAFAALVFFGVAAVIAVLGVRDLRALVGKK